MRPYRGYESGLRYSSRFDGDGCTSRDALHFAIREVCVIEGERMMLVSEVFHTFVGDKADRLLWR